MKTNTGGRGYMAGRGFWTCLLFGMLMAGLAPLGADAQQGTASLPMQKTAGSLAQAGATSDMQKKMESGTLSVRERTIYAIKGTDTLWFEQYQPVAKPNGMSVLFVHGGGFSGGDPANQYPMGEGLAKLGYRVFVINYRLYMKGKNVGCTAETAEKLKAFRYAAEDAIDATSYLVTHAAALQVDTTKLFLAGSSAGAEAILNAVFNPFVRKGIRGFRYAGALSFAGAVIDMNTVNRDNWVTLFLMHGTRDQLVPYGTAAHHFCRATDAGWLMLSGSKTLYNEGVSQKLPVVLYTYEGQGHEVSNYMFRCFTEMDGFMRGVVAGNKMGQREIVR